jgi:hypothetical protein
MSSAKFTAPEVSAVHQTYRFIYASISIDKSSAVQHFRPGMQALALVVMIEVTVECAFPFAVAFFEI